MAWVITPAAASWSGLLGVLELKSPAPNAPKKQRDGFLFDVCQLTLTG